MIKVLNENLLNEISGGDCSCVRIYPANEVAYFPGYNGYDCLAVCCGGQRNMKGTLDPHFRQCPDYREPIQRDYVNPGVTQTLQNLNTQF